MYAMLTKENKVVSSLLQLKTAAEIMTSIGYLTLTRVQDIRAIAVKQGEGPTDPVFCESTADALAEGIFVEEGWAGYVGVKDHDVTIQINYEMTTAYFGSTLVWYSTGGCRLGRHINKIQVRALCLLPQQDIIAKLMKLYHEH